MKHWALYYKTLEVDETHKAQEVNETKTQENYKRHCNNKQLLGKGEALIGWAIGSPVGKSGMQLLGVLTHKGV